MKAATALLAAVVACLAGCTKNDSAPGMRHPWTHAGVLRVAVAEEPKNLNPLLAGTTIEIFIDRLMFEPLLSADARGRSCRRYISPGRRKAAPQILRLLLPAP